MREQKHTTPRPLYGAGWTELEVVTTDAVGQRESRVTIRSRTGEIDQAAARPAPFVDVAIEEYVGTTRRAKYTSVRLEEAAARELYAQLGRILGAA